MLRFSKVSTVAIRRSLRLIVFERRLIFYRESIPCLNKNFKYINIYNLPRALTLVQSFEFL